MTYANKLYSLARELLDMCNNKSTFDVKFFDMRMKNFASLYKKADLETQSLYHELWCNGLLAE